MSSNEVDQWILSHVGAGSCVLELCAGDGTRAIRTAIKSEARRWMLTDADEQSLFRSKSWVESIEAPEFEHRVFSVESDWRIFPQADLAISRNCLHLLTAPQLAAMFGQCALSGLPLLLVNCFDLSDPTTHQFQTKILRDHGNVWPQEFVLQLAQDAGLILAEEMPFDQDESCEIYGGVVGLRFEAA